MSDAENIEEAISHWEKLAEEMLAAADWEERQRNDPYNAVVKRRKAESYKRAAQSLRLELETGLPHCSCCLKPLPTWGRDGGSFRTKVIGGN